MNTKPAYWKNVLYKFLCCALLSGFVYYWLFTAGIVFFNRKTRAIFPNESRLYTSFFSQNWRFFSTPQEYSSELNFIIRSKNDTTITDTLYLDKYWMQQKRQHNPFNSYEDALERALNSVFVDIDRAAGYEKKLLQQKMPGKEDGMYAQQVFGILNNQQKQQKNIDYLEKYGKHILTQKNTNTVEKDFQMVLVRNYILPATAPLYKPGNINSEIIFISPYKPF